MKTMNMMIKQRLRTGALIVAAGAMALSTLASTQTVAADSQADVLKMSPVRTDVTINPGEKKTVKITVTNPSDGSVTVDPVENDFVAADESGAPALILNADQYAPTHSLKRFMKPLSKVTIPAHKSKTVDVLITVPKDAQAGGYFGAVRFVPVASADGGQVNLTTNVASLILLTVPGNVVEKLNLTDFNVQQNGKNGSLFTTPDNLQISARFENKGNVQVAPFGKITVKSGDKVVYEADFNNQDPRDMVLPDSARRWNIPLKDIGTFGHYTVTATFSYGKSNQSVDATTSFWVIPTGVIFIAVVGLLVLVALIVGIWLFLRGYKRRILRNNGMHRRR